jgi:hypothetical protein
MNPELKRKYEERLRFLERGLLPDDGVGRRLADLAWEILYHEGRPPIITEQQEWLDALVVDTTRALKYILLADARDKVVAAKAKRIKVERKGLADKAEDKAIEVMLKVEIMKKRTRLSAEGLRDGLKHPGRNRATLQRIGAKHPTWVKHARPPVEIAKEIATEILGSK